MEDKMKSFILAGYSGSRDYEKLADLAKEKSIICILDYEDREGNKTREVARTSYVVRKNGDGGVWGVNGKGYGFITAFSQKEFVLFCYNNNLEFLEP